MKMNKAHVNILVENSTQKPLSPKAIKLICPGACVFSKDTDKEAYGLIVPPLRWFPPPANDFLNPIDALTPDESVRQGIFILVNFNWLTNEFGHIQSP